MGKLVKDKDARARRSSVVSSASSFEESALPFGESRIQGGKKRFGIPGFGEPDQ